MKLLDQVHTIIMELDQPKFIDGGYEKVLSLLNRLGFKRVWTTHDTFNFEPWSRMLTHVILRKNGLQGKPTCEEFARLHQFDKTLLHCGELYTPSKN